MLIFSFLLCSLMHRFLLSRVRKSIIRNRLFYGPSQLGNVLKTVRIMGHDVTVKNGRKFECIKERNFCLLVCA